MLLLLLLSSNAPVALGAHSPTLPFSAHDVNQRPAADAHSKLAAPLMPHTLPLRPLDTIVVATEVGARGGLGESSLARPRKVPSRLLGDHSHDHDDRHGGGETSRVSPQVAASAFYVRERLVFIGKLGPNMGSGSGLVVVELRAAK